MAKKTLIGAKPSPVMKNGVEQPPIPNQPMPQRPKTPEQVKAEQKVDERVSRYTGLVHTILRLIAEERPFVGKIDEQKIDEHYMPLAGKILEEMVKENINYADRTFIFQLVKQAIELTELKVNRSLEITFDKAMKTIFKKEFMDLSLNDIDKMLKDSQPK